MSVFDIDNWHEVFSTLRKNKLRTFLTACGVFWGIFMLVLMLGFGEGLERGVTKNMLGFVSNSVYVWGQRTTKPYRGMQPGRPVRFDNADIDVLARELRGLSLIAPRIQLGGWRDGNNVTHGEKTGNFGVMGDVPAIGEIEHIRPYQGRFLNPLDLDEYRKVAVIGEQVRRVLFDPGETALGQYIKIRGVYFRVIGVVKSEQPGQQGERADSTLHVPFTTFQRTFNANNQIGWFSLNAYNDYPAEKLEKQARRLLARQHAVDPTDQNAIGSYNAGQTVERVDNLFTGIRFFIWFVGVATLLAGTIGVSNIMLISVKERTKEIGVRKALGATPGSIVLLVIQEASLLTTLAGYSGLVVGVLCLELSESLLTQTEGPLGAPNVNITVALVAAGILSVAGVLAGIAPSRHAAAIHPVEALRAE